jgi:hypothetical protein
MKVIQHKGSFEEVGRVVGEASRRVIPGLHTRVVEYLLAHTTVGSFRRMSEIADQYVQSTKRYWSPAIDYLRGLAEGAGVSFGTVALIAFSEEIASEFTAAPSKCSTFVVWTPNGHILGHNEDYEPHYFGEMILLDATFDGFGRVVGLTYPGMLPNLAGSLNAHGLAILNNSFWVDACLGISKQAQHFRASLLPDMENAVKVLSQQPIALTTHYTVAHGPSHDAVSLEVSNPKRADAYMSLRQIARESFHHTNHVLALSLKEPDPAVVAGNHSLARLAKLQALPLDRHPWTPEEMVELLSVNDGILHRTPEQNPTSVTLATVVIRPATGEFLVRDADPSATIKDHRYIVSRNPLN